MTTERPRGIQAVVLSAVVEDGRILLLRRAREPYRGFWAIPGGKIEFGETPVDAVVREAREETGLAARFLHWGGVASETMSGPDGCVTAHFLLLVGVLAVEGGELREGPEGRLRWFSRDEVADGGVIPTDRELLERFVWSGSRVDVPHFAVGDAPGHSQ